MINLSEEKKRIIRNDIIVILTPLVIALILLIFTLPSRDTGASVKITLNGNALAEYPLSEDLSVPIERDGEILLVLHIEGGEAYVTSSVCHDHSCERMGRISRTGESIICLISQVVITVEGTERDVDAVAFIGRRCFGT